MMPTFGTDPEQEPAVAGAVPREQDTGPRERDVSMPHFDLPAAHPVPVTGEDGAGEAGWALPAFLPPDDIAPAVSTSGDAEAFAGLLTELPDAVRLEDLASTLIRDADERIAGGIARSGLPDVPGGGEPPAPAASTVGPEPVSARAALEAALAEAIVSRTAAAAPALADPPGLAPAAALAAPAGPTRPADPSGPVAPAPAEMPMLAVRPSAPPVAPEPSVAAPASAALPLLGVPAPAAAPEQAASRSSGSLATALLRPRSRPAESDDAAASAAARSDGARSDAAGSDAAGSDAAGSDAAEAAFSAEALGIEVAPADAAPTGAATLSGAPPVVTELQTTTLTLPLQSPRRAARAEAGEERPLMPGGPGAPGAPGGPEGPEGPGKGYGGGSGDGDGGGSGGGEESTGAPAGRAVEWARVPRVNLLPIEIIETRARRRTLVRLGLAVASVTLLTGAGVVYTQWQVGQAEEELAAVQARTSLLQAEQGRYAEVPRTLAALDAARQARENALGRDVLWFRFLTDLAVNTPGDAELSSLTVAMSSTGTKANNPLGVAGLGDVKISGKAGRFTAVSDWLESVAKVHGLEAVTLLSAARDADQKSITYSGSAVIGPGALSHRYDRKAG